MVSLQDLERLTAAKAVQTEDGVALQKNVTLGNLTQINNDAAYIPKEVGVLAGDTWYVPCRMFAEAIGYMVSWGKWGENEMIILEAKEMPELTLDVVYDKNTDKLQATIQNKEPQAFLYGLDFGIEKKTENGWERVKEAELAYVDDIGFTMNGKRTGNDGTTTLERSVYAKLDAGEYRMILPFSYTYSINGKIAGYLKEKLQNGTLERQDWDLYYSSQYGKPEFYFNGDGVSSTYDMQRTTQYLLYGTFTVEKEGKSPLFLFQKPLYFTPFCGMIKEMK